MPILAYSDDIFNRIREVPAVEVARHFGVDMQQKGSRWTALCPFHTEKTPSFSEYKNRFHCFGCGWSGDAVDLAAELSGARPIEAAREIARAFGIPADDSREFDPAARDRLEAMRRERELKAEAARQELKAYLRVAALYRASDRAVSTFETEDDLEQYGDVLHLREAFERILAALRSRDTEERQAAVAAAKGWLT